MSYIHTMLISHFEPETTRREIQILKNYFQILKNFTKISIFDNTLSLALFLGTFKLKKKWSLYKLHGFPAMKKN